MKMFGPLSLFFCFIVLIFPPQSLSFEQDSEISVLTKKSNQGDSSAQYLLASKYWAGNGINQSYDKAISLYRKAAKQGHAGAQFNLGYIYEKGLGLPQDYFKATVWYKAASEKGFPEARKSYLNLSRYMSKDSINKVAILAAQAKSSRQSPLPSSPGAWARNIQPAAGR